MRWLARLVGRTSRETSLDKELTFHVEQRVADLMNDGLSEQAARRQVRLEFGGLDQVKEECRDALPARAAAALVRDLRHAFRVLWRKPSFTIVAVLAIALGIGANTALFSVVNAVLLQPLPYSEPERLVMVWETRADRNVFNNVVSNANYFEWKARNRVFDAISPTMSGRATLLGVGEPEEIRTELVGEEFFPMLGTRMRLGRNFTADECRRGGPDLVVLSEALWRSRFGSDRGIVGRTVRLGSDSAEVVGVAAGDLLPLGTRPPSLWRNARVAATNPNGQRSSGRNMAVLARLRRGVTVAQADREMAQIAKQLEREVPEANARWGARVSPLAEEMTGKARLPLLVMLGAVGCVLLIACANVANLLLARAAGRSRELAVRVSLGATRGTLIRQLLAESMTLAVAGAALGMVVGWGLLQVLKATGPQDLRRLEQASLSPVVLAYTFGIMLAAGLLPGLAPAFLAAGRAVNDSVRDGARGATAGARTGLLREAFTVAEVALSLILLVGAGLLLQSFAKLTSTETGFRTSRVLTAEISLPSGQYSDEAGVHFFEEVTRRLRSLPGVVSASSVTFLPFRGMGAATSYWRADRPKPANGQEPVADVRIAQPGYFETMNIPLKRGRTLTPADNDPSAPLRFVVSESAVRSLFPEEEPLGKEILVMMGRKNSPGEVIGVIGDVKHDGLDGKVRATVYYPPAKLFFGLGTIVVQTAVPDPMTLARPLAGVVREMDPELAISEMGTMEQWIDGSVARPKFQARLLAGFALLALVLAVIGIYGVMSYGVAQRTQEIGVRMALGARTSDVARMILGRAMGLTVLGLVVGIAGTVLLGRFLESLLFEVKATDPVTLVVVAGILLGVATVASYVPARRAMGVDPTLALRYE